jgi:signal transduction histidine kinase
MKTPAQMRLTGLIITLVLGGALVGFTERHAWQQGKQLQRRLQGMQDGGFHLADHLEAVILRLNQMLLRYDLHEHPADRERFLRDSVSLERWLGQHQAKAESQTERALLAEIRSAFNDYLAYSSRILEESARTTGPGSPAALFDRTEQISNRLLELRNRLAEAQRASLQRALVEAEESLSELQLLLALSFGVLLTVSVVFGVVVYRSMIAPLRVKLMETGAIVERQEKLASLGALAAGVAHEIRNPLTAIKARLFTQQKLLREHPEPLADNRFISEEISRLDDFIKNFLTFARPAEPRLEAVRATTPLREVARLLQPEMDKNSITLRQEFLADPEVNADPQQLRQVLLNLIKNAVESVGANGCITLRTRTRPSRPGARSPRLAVMEVEDNGPGIPIEVQKRLFDPFFTTKETGTGLGLSLAARILEKHGGTLEYQTQVGRGSVFSVILPFAQHRDGGISQNSIDRR